MSDAFASLLEPLNPAQRKAVICPGHTLVVACPGSGKTKVLTTRSAYMLMRDKCALVGTATFTKDSAEEMAHRIAGMTSEADRKRVISGTFHALAMQQLKKAKKRIKLLGPGEQRSLIFRAMDSAAPGIEYEEACKHIEHMKSSLEPIAEFKVQDDLYHCYQGMLTQLGGMDFQDLMILAVRGMQDGSVAPLPVQYLLVDEYQDADGVQHQWVYGHTAAGAIVTVVGDDDQSIYGWRNARGYQGMLQFQQAHSAETVTLDINYRSRREILQLGEQLILHNRERLPKSLRTQQGPGGDIYSRRFFKRDEEMEAIAEATAEKPEEWAVIARTNSILNHVQAQMDVAGIPYHRVGGSNFWNAPGPSAVLLLVNSVVHGEALGAEHALHFTGCDQDALYRVHVSRGLSAHAGPYQSVGSNDVDDFASKLGKWREQYARGFDDLVVTAAVSWLRSKVSNKKTVEKIEMAASVLKRLNGRLDKRLQTLQRKKDDKEKPAGVSLMTMHASKGLEFDRVWICGMEADVCPHVDSVNIDEERRLFYVGITRARKDLRISSCSQQGKPSMFMVELGFAKPPIEEADQAA